MSTTKIVKAGKITQPKAQLVGKSTTKNYTLLDETHTKVFSYYTTNGMLHQLTFTTIDSESSHGGMNTRVHINPFLAMEKTRTKLCDLMPVDIRLYVDGTEVIDHVAKLAFIHKTVLAEWENKSQINVTPLIGRDVERARKEQLLKDQMTNWFSKMSNGLQHLSLTDVQKWQQSIFKDGVFK